MTGAVFLYMENLYPEGSTLFAPPPYDQKLYTLLMDYCLRIMGRKSYSVRELSNKMKQKVKRLEKYTPGRDATTDELAMTAVLAKLQEWNYLSDKKIIEYSLDAATTYKPQGRTAFVYSMMKKGINKDEAHTAWAIKNVDERKLAAEVMKKYTAKYAKFSLQERKRKMAGLLARKGFSGEVVWSAIEKMH